MTRIPVNFDTPSNRIQTFVDQFLRTAHSDFGDGARALPRLCNLDLSFGGGASLQYEEPLVQQAYLIRYGLSYFAEYYLIYRQLLENVSFGSCVNVISIGCGCGIDCWGLKFAAQSANHGDTDVRYLGIDEVEWLYQDLHNQIVDSSVSGVRFMRGDITAKGKKLTIPSDSIVIFPKSLGDIGAIGGVEEMIKRSRIDSDILCLVGSYRETYERKDRTRVERIASVVSEAYGYKEVSRFTHDTVFDKEKLYVASYVPGCWYPKDLVGNANDLRTYCRGHMANRCEHNGECSRKRMITLKGNYWRWLSIVLQKQDSGSRT